MPFAASLISEKVSQISYLDIYGSATIQNQYVACMNQVPASSWCLDNSVVVMPATYSL